VVMLTSSGKLDVRWMLLNVVLMVMAMMFLFCAKI